MADETEIERDELECGVLFVGAGPANLAGAIRLMDLITEHNEAIEKGAAEGEPIDVEETPIMVIEKSSDVGDHVMSGAILDPRALRELIPGYEEHEPAPPFEGPATKDHLWFLRPGGGKLSPPILPPTFNNHGNQIISLNRFVKWLAEIAEEKGVQVLPGFPGSEVLFDAEQAVRGVRTADKGVSKEGEAKGSFEPGTDILAPITVFGEGSRGSLTRGLVRRFSLDAGKNPQIYSTGVKEVWKVPAGRIEPGTVIHTAGHPLKLFGQEFGGGWLYALKDDHVSVGFVVSLDSPDPTLDPHRLFSEYKSHPAIKAILEGGEVVRYGAKTIPEGGWFSLPRPYVAGGMLVGDSAGFLNMSRLKGIHLAMKSGMLAAETAFEILRDKKKPTETACKPYWERVCDSWVFREMWKVRNFRAAFQKGTFARGMIAAGLHIQSGGLWPPGRVPLQDDHVRMRKLKEAPADAKPNPGPLEPKVDTAARVAALRSKGVDTKAPPRPAEAPAPSVKSEGIVYDKVTDVYYSGANHEEDQPPHLVVTDVDVCHTRCAEEYGNPCQYFCPAAVYEMSETEDGQGRQLKLNFSNCVHCKTCDVRDPYQIITWVTPEGGGPVYSGL